VARETHDSPGKVEPPGLDAVVADLAARQWGVVTLRQLEACGLTRGAIEHRLATRRLQRLWRGVYAFGHQELTRQGQLIAAVFACGRGAGLSHLTAAVEWEMLMREADALDITVPARSGRRRQPGIRLHCVRRLDPDDVTLNNGIPITTPARTLIDLSAVVSDRLVERALEQAQIRRLLPPGALEAALERSHGRKTRVLRALVATERRVSTVTRSELEERFLALVRHAGLPDPEVNVRIGGYEVDFLWRVERRVIEVDGHAYHSTRQATTRDRRKDDDLEAAGFRVTRFTADQILHNPGDTLARTARALAMGQ
jgi:very-short-patch-repair endonuclease